ncbi:MAG: cytochrome ubiquinol oxidase subunit I [Candidatus Marinimicrobia bacterium]|nr:cytochrome ubiquinol oxidase subunit I [Candidatus Neomarinimicrobiota bacterium]MCF7880233.1 cytochrome ubiquinol oxidase subunit I [Candidatus Neomarinimicrobiota bacterium]
MDVLFLSRLQFALTIGFHYIYPPMSIGLGVILVIMEGMYMKTGLQKYHNMTKFWVKIFGLIFAIGVATGIVMEFEFGTNWAVYSRYVGDVFGSALAAEGVFAFFLESGFLAILLFGWDKVSKTMHFISTVLVAFGAHFSAVWIVVANSWQQTPAGFHIVGTGMDARAEITDFWAMVFNPSSMDRLWHVLMGSWQAGAWLVISVSAFYLIKKKHKDFARSSIKIALSVALVASLLQLWSGHSSAIGVSETQPAKMAAMEGHYGESAPAPMYLFGWVNDNQQEVKFGLEIPGMLSWLITGDANTPIQGLRSFSPENRPPVNIVFQSYHLMVAIGMTLILLSILGIFYWWRDDLFEHKWLLWIFVFAVLLPHIANQVGWIAAEVGRQPWIVYGLLRTSEGISEAVTANMVMGSLVMFTLIYLLLFAVFVYLLNEKIQHGPDAVEEESVISGHRA